MDQQRSSLCVSIHNVEFAKDFNYFITVQVNADGEKVTSLLYNKILKKQLYFLKK